MTEILVVTFLAAAQVCTLVAILKLNHRLRQVERRGKHTHIEIS